MKLGLLPLYNKGSSPHNDEAFHSGGLSFFSTALLAEVAAFIHQRLPDINCTVYNKLPPLVADFPDVVLIWCTSVEFGEVSAWAESIKAALDCPVWLAGPHISYLPQSLPSQVDLGIMGEVELPLFHLLKTALQNGPESLNPTLYRKIPGLIYQSRGRMYSGAPAQEIPDLKSLPTPDISIFKNTKNYMVASLRTSRSNDSIMTRLSYPPTRKPRLYSPDQVCQNMVSIVQQFKDYLAGYPFPPRVFRQYCPIFISDYLFVLQKKRLQEIVAEMRRLHLHEVCFLIVHLPVRAINEELLRLLKSVNLQKVMLSFGPFGHDNPLLPPCTPHELDKALALCHQFRVGILEHTYMNPSPKTQRRHIFAFYKHLQKRADAFEVLVTSVLGPFPGLELWEQYQTVRKKRADLPDIESFPWHTLDWKKFHRTLPVAQPQLDRQLLTDASKAFLRLGEDRITPFTAPFAQTERTRTEVLQVKAFAETYLFPEARLLEVVLLDGLALKPYLSSYHEVLQLHVKDGKVVGELPTEPVDMLVCSAALHGVRYPEQALDFMLKGLRPGGLAHFTILNPMFMGHMARVFKWPARQSLADYDVLKWFTDTELLKLLSQQNLTLVEVKHNPILQVENVRPTVELLARQFENFAATSIPQHALYIHDINVVVRKEE